MLLVLLLVSLSSGLCPDHWLLLGQRCFAVYPVWASWSSAETLCSQSDSHLVSLRSNKDVEFVQKIVTKLSAPVWTGGYSLSQSDVWFWSDGSDFDPDVRTNRSSGNFKRDAACLEMTTEDGEVKSAPCAELRFYICSRKISSESYSTEQAVVPSGLAPGVSLFALMWDQSESVMEETLRSSSLLRQLQAGSVAQSCYELFSQQEALYKGLLYRMLQAMAFTPEADPGVKSLLLEATEFYQTRVSKQDLSAAPLWLQFALQSFHSLVAEEPVYLLVALSARAALNSFVLQSLPPPQSGAALRWRQEREGDVDFTHRARKVIENLQSKMDVFKSIDIFRRHMMNQKSLHKHVECHR